MKLYFHMKLKQILEKRGIQQKELAQMTGLREATISELVNDSRSAYNKNHILKIMEVLKISDLSELLEVRSIEDK
jgi:putative transcriptional regulator